MRGIYLILIVLLFATACRAKSPEHFLAQGRFVNQELLAEIQAIDDLDDLIEALPRLERLFGRLVDVMIEAKKWQIKHKACWPATPEDRQLSLELQAELARLYEMPSARALIEKCQETALLRLDSH